MSTNQQFRTVIIDANNLIFRSFFGVPHLNTSFGTPTNAVYGCLKFLKVIINDLKPKYLIICWDNGGKTFRHNADSNYKANRPVTDDNLKVQFDLVKDILNRLSIPQIVAPAGIECDDLIGTFAVKASEGNHEVFIVSSDKDFFQLINQNIKVYSLTLKKKNKGNAIVDLDYIKNNFHVENPLQLNHIKALTGEKTDNIQGVKGIGPKTATS